MNGPLPPVISVDRSAAGPSGRGTAVAKVGDGELGSDAAVDIDVDLEVATVSRVDAPLFELLLLEHDTQITATTPHAANRCAVTCSVPLHAAAFATPES